MFVSYELAGKTSAELNTELRFLIASSKYESTELILIYSEYSDDEEKKRLTRYTKTILNKMKREEFISFYITDSSFDKKTTEYEFLKNKYGEKVKELQDKVYFYVKTP